MATDSANSGTEIYTGNVKLESIDVSKIVSTVVTLNEDTYDLNIKKLNSLNVLGLFLPGGYSYTTTHKRRSHVPDHLYDQVYFCLKNNLLFGLVYHIRSRTLEEAKEECKDIYYLVSKYPPGMGIWFKLEFPDSQSKKRNNKIIDLLYERLTSWGLANGCGFYADDKALAKIDWSTYKSKFLLWYINHFTSKNQLEQTEDLLNPDFFKRS